MFFRSDYFVGTGPPGPSTNILYCQSQLPAVLTNVFSTSTLAEGPIPQSHSLMTISLSAEDLHTVFADIIQVRWQSTDTEILQLLTATTSSSTNSPSTSPTASLPRSTTAAMSTLPSSPSTSPNGNHIVENGLSTGVKIAIGVAVPVAFMALLLGAFFFWRKKNSRRRLAPYAEPQYIQQSQELHSIEGKADFRRPHVATEDPKHSTYGYGFRGELPG